MPDHMHYAAYGSNLHPHRLRLRAPSARLLGTAHLPTWSLRFHKRSRDASAKCNVVPTAGGLHVAVFDVSREDMQKLDGIEGVGEGYDHLAIDIPGFSACTTYVAADSHVDDSLLAYDWYREIVLLGCMFHGLPAAYIDAVRRTPVICDPDLKRSQANWTIVEELRAMRSHI